MADKILIVDDDRELRCELRELLEGYDVIEASNGEEAVGILKKANEIGLVILDVMMPGMNGIELIKKIREINAELRRKPVPEVLITAYADESAYLQALKLNVTAYLHKPFDMNEFLDIVAKRVAGDGPGG